MDQEIGPARTSCKLYILPRTWAPIRLCQKSSPLTSTTDLGFDMLDLPYYQRNFFLRSIIFSGQQLLYTTVHRYYFNLVLC